MQRHVRNYYDALGLAECDLIYCEICGAVATDLHHVKYRSEGGSDHYDNLVALCRPHHDFAHKHKDTQQILLLDLIKSRK